MDTDTALRRYLEHLTGDELADLEAALPLACNWRYEGPEATASLVVALYFDHGWSLARISEASYDPVGGHRIPRGTIQNWIDKAAEAGRAR